MTRSCSARAAAILALTSLLAGWAARPSVAANPIQAENALPGSTGWNVSEARPRQIEGYTSQTSVLPGQALELHVSTTPAALYRIDVYRLGWYGGAGGRLMACLPGCGATESGESRPVSRSDPNGEVQAGWPVTDVLQVPAAWPSGYYVAQLVLGNGLGAGSSSNVPFVVREPPGRHSQILVQVPVNTWEAYNGWGGKSLYDFNSSGGQRANRVSFDRPFFTGIGRQELSMWELPLVHFLEREGYDVSYQTDVDTDANPASLLDHRLVMTAGHGEYWTKVMRDGFEAALAQGTNLAFMGANTGYWQVRYEDRGRTIVNYKSLADPEPSLVLKTSLFRELGRPECGLEGVQHAGGRLNWGRADYTVTAAGAADPWLAGTGLTAGSRIANAVSVERDSANGDPRCASPLTILFHYEAGAPELGNADAVRYTAKSGARVFSSGSLEFPWALDAFHGPFVGVTPTDPRVQQFARNALDDLTRPAPLTSVEAFAGGFRYEPEGQEPRGLLSQRRGVVVQLAGPADPRVEWHVLRRAGDAADVPAAPAWQTVCSASVSICLDVGVRPGTYRYAAVAVDAWGQSTPVYAQPVVVLRR